MAFVNLNRKAQQQSDNRDFDDDIGEHQRLHDRVNRLRIRGDVREYRRDAARPIPYGKQQHISRRLDHSRAQNQMHEVPAGDDPIKAHQEQPCRNRVREIAQCFLSSRSSSK